jgi:hypothetical protein
MVAQSSVMTSHAALRGVPLLFLVQALVGAAWGCSGGTSDPPGADSSSDPRTVCNVLATRAQCAAFDGNRCLDAPAGRTVADYVAQHQAFAVEAPYPAACDGAYLYDVVVDPSSPDIWLRTVFTGDVNTEQRCAEVVLHVAMYRRVGGQWEAWDTYRIMGSWDGAVCRTAICGGGKLDDDTLNRKPDFPWSWVDATGVERVRVMVSGSVGACEPVALALSVSDSFL